MTMAEFEGWKEFYVRYPFDDYHRFHRPAALVAGSFGRSMSECLDWLAPDAGVRGMSEADMTTMRAMGYTRKGR